MRRTVWNRIRHGDSRQLLAQLTDECIDLSIWSPPYHVGREYEQDTSQLEWRELLRAVTIEHGRILRPGAFAVINIGDIKTYPDPLIARHKANVTRLRCPVTTEHVARLRSDNPEISTREMAGALNCSEQTIERRVLGSLRRGGGASQASTRILASGELLIEYAAEAGLYLYDHRIWAKSPAWKNSPWHPTSYRAVDEWENLYFFCSPVRYR